MRRVNKAARLKITVSNGGILNGMNSEQYDKASTQWEKLLREIGRN